MMEYEQRGRAPRQRFRDEAIAAELERQRREEQARTARSEAARRGWQTRYNRTLSEADRTLRETFEELRRRVEQVDRENRQFGEARARGFEQSDREIRQTVLQQIEHRRLVDEQLRQRDRAVTFMRRMERARLAELGKGPGATQSNVFPNPDIGPHSKFPRMFSDQLALIDLGSVDFFRTYEGLNIPPPSPEPDLGKDLGTAGMVAGPGVLLGYFVAAPLFAPGSLGYLLYARKREIEAGQGLPAGTQVELQALAEKRDRAIEQDNMRILRLFESSLTPEQLLEWDEELASSQLSAVELLRLKAVAASQMIGIMEWTDP